MEPPPSPTVDSRASSGPAPVRSSERAHIHPTRFTLTHSPLVSTSCSQKPVLNRAKIGPFGRARRFSPDPALTS